MLVQIVPIPVVPIAALPVQNTRILQSLIGKFQGSYTNSDVKNQTVNNKLLASSLNNRLKEQEDINSMEPSNPHGAIDLSGQEIINLEANGKKEPENSYLDSIQFQTLETAKPIPDSKTLMNHSETKPLEDKRPEYVHLITSGMMDHQLVNKSTMANSTANFSKTNLIQETNFTLSQNKVPGDVLPAIANSSAVTNYRYSGKELKSKLPASRKRPCGKILCLITSVMNPKPNVNTSRVSIMKTLLDKSDSISNISDVHSNASDQISSGSNSIHFANKTNATLAETLSFPPNGVDFTNGSLCCQSLPQKTENITSVIPSRLYLPFIETNTQLKSRFKPNVTTKRGEDVKAMPVTPEIKLYNQWNTVSDSKAKISSNPLVGFKSLSTQHSTAADAFGKTKDRPGQETKAWTQQKTYQSKAPVLPSELHPQLTRKHDSVLTLNPHTSHGNAIKHDQ